MIDIMALLPLKMCTRKDLHVVQLTLWFSYLHPYQICPPLVNMQLEGLTPRSRGKLRFTEGSQDNLIGLDKVFGLRMYRLGNFLCKGTD